MDKINVHVKIVFVPKQEIYDQTSFGTKDIIQAAKLIDAWIKQSEKLTEAYNDPDSKLIISIW